MDLINLIAIMLVLHLKVSPETWYREISRMMGFQESTVPPYHRSVDANYNFCRLGGVVAGLQVGRNGLHQDLIGRTK